MSLRAAQTCGLEMYILLDYIAQFVVYHMHANLLPASVITLQPELCLRLVIQNFQDAFLAFLSLFQSACTSHAPRCVGYSVAVQIQPALL